MVKDQSKKKKLTLFHIIHIRLETDRVSVDLTRTDLMLKFFRDVGGLRILMELQFTDQSFSCKTSPLYFKKICAKRERGHSEVKKSLASAQVTTFRSVKYYTIESSNQYILRKSTCRRQSILNFYSRYQFIVSCRLRLFCNN